MQNSNARQYHPEADTRRRDYLHDHTYQRRNTMPEYRPDPNIHNPAPKHKRRKKVTDEYTRIRKGSKNMPSIFKRGNIFFIVENENGQYRLPRTLLISLLVIFVCAVVAVTTQVQISGMERQIASSNRQLDNLMIANETVYSQISAYYTLDEIEYFAISRLGMIHPDPSQIIEIYVPRQNNAEFNADAHLLPTENSLWRDVRTFLNGIFDRMFGG